MSIARVVSTKQTSSITNGMRTVGVGYVDRTDQWSRSFLSSGVEAAFKAVAEKNIDSYRPDTTAVALQETPHTSSRDNRTHFTAVEVNKDGKVVAKRHFSVE
ncbi:hypothetical protein HYFRA_00009319 [Hymenoscyphus fraxineus]|uniref:Uncharacterized protein n=1 Tax=Hymenoscyphus fraxineus TaxID=746836 RepID=A0A9N9L2S2_9HELO|nr:hypothetical protein HYFRA_00009319 [Hymenoscyphus fraxineus]